MKKTSLILMVLLITTIANSQNISSNYRTINGRIIMNTIVSKTAIKLNSNSAIIKLNYENGKFKIIQKVSELTSSNTELIDTYNTNNEDIIIEGKLDLDYINTNEHAPIGFSFEAYLKPGETLVRGEGKLVHLIEKSNSACVISMSFSTNAENINNIKFEPGQSVKFEIIQSLMAREGD